MGNNGFGPREAAGAAPGAVPAAEAERSAAAPADAKRIEIWFQDEARVGQKDTLERVWAPKNTRPRIQRDHRYGYCYLFGATCASRGKVVGLVADRASTESMNEHLGLIGTAVTEGAHAVPVLDGAGWHKSAGLVVPANLSLLFLPPYSPELNPMEQVFQFLRANRFSNRVFATVEVVRQACKQAWEWLQAMPGRIASITHRDSVAQAEANLCPNS